MKTDLFQSCGHCWVFQICWHIECSTFTASSSRIWNSLTGIPSPPLALFVVMLPKAHLTPHSRMSGSRWVIDHTIVIIWVMKIFLHNSSVYSYHLFLISSASFRSLPFLSFTEPIFAWNVPLPNFLEEIFSISHSVVSLYFFALITEEGFLISPYLFLEFSDAYIFPFLLCFFTFLLFTAIFKASSDSHFAFFLFFFFLGMVLIPVSCTVLRTSIHSSSGTLSCLVP